MSGLIWVQTVLKKLSADDNIRYMYRVNKMTNYADRISQEDGPIRSIENIYP